MLFNEGAYLRKCIIYHKAWNQPVLRNEF